MLTVAAVVIINRGASPPRRTAQQSNEKGALATTPTGSTIAGASHHVVPGSGDLLAEPAVAAYLVATTDEDVTAAVYDDVTGYTSVFRPGTPEVTGSSMKMDILATLLAQDQSDRKSLTPSQQGLSESMIEDSDNNGA